ncbi:thioesterase domain-containing protein [Kitasatospora sp. NPDC005856]|uniref:thioesterase II family protein n=1 Tax=Kitasatospora sp. NPDC005856 TaxID=3154566 RepID=UPI0033F420C5
MPVVPQDPAALWFRCFEPRPHAAWRLFAFPFAGSGAAVYRPWTVHLPSTVELRAVQLPGRQDRIAEPAEHDLAELVGRLADEIEPLLTERPFAFFGHSMGALLAVELTRELRRRGAPQPLALGLSGWPNPRGGLPRESYEGLSDEQFLDRVTRLGGIPDEVLAAPELLDLVLPTLRADFTVVESHVYREQEPFDLPVSVFGGTGDPFTVAGGLADWQYETSSATTVRQYPGRHFYLLQHAPAVLGAFAADVRAALDATEGRTKEDLAWR